MAEPAEDKHSEAGSEVSSDAASAGSDEKKITQESCVRIALEAEKRILSHPDKCSQCALLKRHCYCDRIENLSSYCAPRYDIWVVFHHKELVRYRGSNTGSLILRSCGGRRCVAWHPPDEEAFVKAVAENRDRAFVLFPSNDAITPQAFLQRLKALDEEQGEKKQQGKGEGEEKKDEAAVAPAAEDGKAEAAGAPGQQQQQSNKRITIIVIDGSWNNARSVNKRVSEITEAAGYKLPRVILKDVTREGLGGGVRKARNAEERVSTMGAFVHLLHELGEPEEITGKLFANLQASIDGYLAQTGKTKKMKLS